MYAGRKTKNTVSYNDNDIWKNHTADMTAESIAESVKHPAIFQKELAVLLNNILQERGNVIEVGCESGVTSFLLKCDRRCFFDLNADIVNKVTETHQLIQPERITDTFVVGDMFDMPFQDEEFDLAFNAGVLEHFSSDEIIRVLREMRRIVVGGGKVVIAIPNHYCGVYRAAYLYGQLKDFLGIKKWAWPKENKFYDLKDEITKSGLSLEKRVILSKASIWNWWGGRRYILIRFLFRLIDRIHPFEGYLTVLVLRKANSGQG